ncbi:MAG: DNA gyrase/topoisomerase IV subunit A [Bacteroidales bacterium]|nr:DNA gyrase/topoisomerase IV subunit A [Bacteroidales bacterium]
MTTDDTLNPQEEPLLDTAGNETAAAETVSGYKPAVKDDNVKYHLTGMYQNWFLDYASYVILERAVPDMYDGLKPVQRRILHAMKCADDGRYNKVANLIGQTMQYHPHGDASIGDALVQLGQKDLLIDCQGNWGNILTGDGAAAPRYIEARLSKFALETVFNPKTTHWMLSYDGRKKEPVNLPVKFPLLLAQGVEGIAVGLNSKILPHNFCELCDASLAYLRGEEFRLFPDFPTGGSIDVSRYNDGERGGVIKIRSKITKSADNKTLIISEIPFGTTSTGIIESIIKANQKGKIKVKKVEDATAAEAQIVVQLQPGSSSDKTIDALYAFTDCEVNISPNCCVIKDKKPIFTNVSQLLRFSTDHTRNLLQWELEIQKSELEEQLFYISLEKIFIEERIYKEKKFEDSTSVDTAIRFIDLALEPFKPQLLREVRREDIQRLLEIKMIRITKFDSKKADEQMAALKKQIKDTVYNLSHLTEYAISWFTRLKEKYGQNHPRRTEIRNFANINIKTVVEANEKLYINRADGFVGTGLRKDEFLCNCSDIDDIIIFYKDGKYKIIKVAEKVFVGTDILHIAIFKKNDTRTIYNVVYRDGKKGFYYMKRFAVTGLARDKEYDLTQGKPGSKVVYFTANQNGEAEVIKVQLKPALHLKKMEVLKDLSELAIKSRTSRGNLLTKFEVQRITLKQKGASTLGGRKVWFDPDVLRINYDGQGQYLGEFQSDDQVLVITRTGDYYTTNFELTAHFENNILRIEKYDAEKIWSVALWDAEQQYYYGKRFTLESTAKPQSFIGDNPESRLICYTDLPEATFLVRYADGQREPLTLLMEEFIAVKSAKAKGKRITTLEVASITDITPEPEPVEEVSETGEEAEETAEDTAELPTGATEDPTEENTGIEMSINASVPEDSLPVKDEDDQLSLF